jgi:hypothetical protein
MFNNNFLTSWRSCLSLLTVSVAMTLAGCSNIPSGTEPITTPIRTPATKQQAPSDDLFTKCPPHNPEQNMCTMQYDPVCVTTKVGSTISYRTAGNACSACGTTAAIGYVPGKCI